jgi:hypothetical protein
MRRICGALVACDRLRDSLGTTDPPLARGADPRGAHNAGAHNLAVEVVIGAATLEYVRPADRRASRLGAPAACRRCRTAMAIATSAREIHRTHHLQHHQPADGVGRAPPRRSAAGLGK